MKTSICMAFLYLQYPQAQNQDQTDKGESDSDSQVEELLVKEQIIPFYLARLLSLSGLLNRGNWTFFLQIQFFFAVNM